MDLYNDRTKISKRLVKKALARGCIGTWYTSTWDDYPIEIAEQKFIPIVKKLVKKRGAKELIGERPTRYRHTLIYGKSKITLEWSFDGYHLSIFSIDDNEN